MKPRRLPNLLIVCSTLPIAAFALDHSFSIEQVMSTPFSSELVAAPSGARVAWIIDEQGRRNVWFAGAPDWVGRKLTSFDKDDGQDIAELRWAPDGSYVLFARGGDFETGGDNPNPELSPLKPEQEIWSVALDGSAPRKLTEGHGAVISPKGGRVAFLRAGQIWMMNTSGQSVTKVVEQKGNQQDLQWSPDGSMLAFVSARKGHSLIGLYSPGDKTLRYVDASVDRDGDPTWSPDGHRIVYLRIPSEGRKYFFEAHREGEPWSIRITDIATGNAREVFRAARGAGSLFHRMVAKRQIFWAAGDQLVFPWERSGWAHLYKLPVGGGEAVELTPGDGEVEHVDISADGRKVFYSSNIGDIDARHLFSIDIESNNKPDQLTQGDAIAWSPTAVADGSVLTYLGSSYNQSAHAIVRSAGGETKALAPATVPAAFPTKELVQPKPIMLTAADGMQIHGQLFLPSESNEGVRHPALIFFHGGSRRQMLLGFHYMQYYSNAYAMNQFYASKGYVVLSVNYRSGIGYGLNFREAIGYGGGGGSEFNDVIGAGLYLKSRPDVDPKRIGVWGGSYGGYLTAMALSRASDLFAAGVDFHGVHDWSTLDGIFSETADVGGDPKAVKAREEAARLAFESSPMASVDTWRSPVLLIHGDDDRNVDFSQTVTLVEALRQRHVEFEELILPNEIHDFLRHASWLKAYEASADFFARKLRAGTETAGIR